MGHLYMFLYHWKKKKMKGKPTSKDSQAVNRVVCFLVSRHVELFYSCRALYKFSTIYFLYLN